MREIEPELPPDFPLQAVRQALEDTFVRAMRSPPRSLDASSWSARQKPGSPSFASAPLTSRRFSGTSQRSAVAVLGCQSQ